MFTQAGRMISLMVVISLAVFGCGTNPLQKEAIATKKAPETIGPYSQAVKFASWLFLAGQIAIDPKTNQLMKDASIKDRTRLVLNNLKAVLEQNGMTLDIALSTTVFLKDLNDQRPASSAVELIDRVKTDLHNHIRHAPKSDDNTMIAVHRQG